MAQFAPDRYHREEISIDSYRENYQYFEPDSLGQSCFRDRIACNRGRGVKREIFNLSTRTKMKSLFTGGKMKLSLPLRRSLSFDRSFLRELNFPPIYQLRYTYFDIFGQTTKISIATSISRKIFSLEQHLPRTFSSRSSIGEKKNLPLRCISCFSLRQRTIRIDPGDIYT